jgi:hypothetical protein
MAVQSKACVCGGSLAEIAGSNSARGIDDCLLWLLFVFKKRSLRKTHHASRGVLPSVVCLGVILRPRKWGGPGLLGPVAAWKKKSWKRRKNSSVLLRTQWNILEQTLAPRCKGSPTFQGLFPFHFPWRWGRIQSLKGQKSFTSFRGCLPENISLYSFTAKNFKIYIQANKLHGGDWNSMLLLLILMFILSYNINCIYFTWI